MAWIIVSGLYQLTVLPHEASPVAISILYNTNHFLVGGGVPLNLLELFLT